MKSKVKCPECGEELEYNELVILEHFQKNHKD